MQSIWKPPSSQKIIAELLSYISSKLELPANKSKYYSLLARLLEARGFNTVQDLQYFFDLDNIQARSGLEIPDMAQALERIKLAVAQKQKIAIFGDYDVDGTTSIALLVRTFRMLDIEVDWRVPNRHTEGYGLSNKAIDEFKVNNVHLLITCDCGITNVAEVDYANSLGMDVIVTDHHGLPEVEPASVANVNPRKLPSEHALADLPGVGVAYKLAELLIDNYIKDIEEATKLKISLRDLVALGIIADLALLRGENRLLVHDGLKVLNRTDKAGLQALLRVSGVDFKPGEDSIGFSIGPRINAIGRLADASLAVELMISDDVLRAGQLAEELDHSNRSRQQLCEETLEEALMLIEQEIDLEQDRVIVLGSENWNHGVIGIVASRLKEKFNMPVFLFAISDGLAKGSSRASDLSGFDLFEEMQAYQKQEQIFSKYGGHPKAAGFSFPAEEAERFKTTLKEYFRQRLSRDDVEYLPIYIDVTLLVQEINDDLIHYQNKLKPFGLGNAKPRYMTGPLVIQSFRLMGKDKSHLKLFLTAKDKQGAPLLEAVLWQRAGDFIESFGSKSFVGEEICLVFSPEINEFNGQRGIQLLMLDWKNPDEVGEEFYARFSLASPAKEKLITS